MAGNTFGKLFTVTTFGESHGIAIGGIIDGCPPGLELCEEDLQGDLDRRKPGTSRYTTARREEDEVKILSGVFEGKTTGTSIGLLINNTDQRSNDYSKIKDTFRPAMLIIPISKNMDYVIIVVVVALRLVKPLYVLPLVAWRKNILNSNMVLKFMAICRS